MINTAKALSKAQRSLAGHLINFRFDCIGSNQTDDELVIAGSLKEFGRLINTIEDERDRMLERAYDNFIVPLETFRKDQVGQVKERKKKFDKQTAKFCASQERYLGLSTKKQDNVLQEVSVERNLAKILTIIEAAVFDVLSPVKSNVSFQCRNSLLFWMRKREDNLMILVRLC